MPGKGFPPSPRLRRTRERVMEFRLRRRLRRDKLRRGKKDRSSKRSFPTPQVPTLIGNRTLKLRKKYSVWGAKIIKKFFRDLTFAFLCCILFSVDNIKEKLFMLEFVRERSDLRIVRAAVSGVVFVPHSYFCSNRCAAAISQYPSDL